MFDYRGAVYMCLSQWLLQFGFLKRHGFSRPGVRPCEFSTEAASCREAVGSCAPGASTGKIEGLVLRSSPSACGRDRRPSGALQAASWTVRLACRRQLGSHSRPSLHHYESWLTRSAPGSRLCLYECHLCRMATLLASLAPSSSTPSSYQGSDWA